MACRRLQEPSLNSSSEYYDLRPLTLLLVLLILLLLLLDQVLPRQRRLRLRYDYDYNGCCDYHDDYY